MKVTLNIIPTKPIKKGFKICKEFLKEEKFSKYEMLHHRALTGYLKKNFCTPKQVEEILKKCPNTSSFIGALPDKWFEHVPKAERHLYSNKVMWLFTNFAQKVSLPLKVAEPQKAQTAVHNSKFIGKIKDLGQDILGKKTEKIEQNPAEVVEEGMKTLVEKFKALTGKDAKISYLGKGSIGRTYKFDTDGDSFVIKTFYPNPQRFGYYSNHGKGAEILSAVYASKNAPKSDYAKFYFGKFARKTDNNGFMVTKYMDFYNANLSNIKNPILREMGLKLYCGDKIGGNNMVLDTIYDYGAITLNNFKNSTQFKIKRQIVNAVDSSDYKKFQSIFKKYDSDDIAKSLEEFKNEVEDMANYGNYFERYQYYELTKHLDPTGVKDSYIQVAESNEKYKYYRLLNRAIKTNSHQAYDDIISTYKGNKIFEEVLKVYNKDTCTPYYIRVFDEYMEMYQFEKLMDTLKKFGFNIANQ